MNQKRSDLIAILGFILTCFMVFYHCGTLDDIPASGVFDASLNHAFSTFFGSMATYAMAHFFTVSGFLHFNKLSFQNYPAKVKRRIHSLLVPYLAWQLIAQLMAIVLYTLFKKDYTYSPGTFFRTTFCFVQWPADGALWYVYSIFLLALLSPLLLLLFRNKTTGWLSVLIIVFLITHNIPSSPLFVQIRSHGYIGLFLFYFPAYLIGAFYGKFSSEIKTEHSLLYAFSFLLIAYLNGFGSQFLSTAIILVLPILGLFSLPVASLLKNRRIYRLSFLIYAMHQPILTYLLNTICRFYIKLSFPASLCNVLIRVTALAVVMISASVTYLFLRKYSPKLLYILTGGRGISS